MKTFAGKAIDFYSDLRIETSLPPGSYTLNPYDNPDVQLIVRTFFTRFYDDRQERTVLLGINPGRFGAGITGITFTDPVRLETFCQIPNPFEKRAELSSRFIYDVIAAYGGCQPFFKRYVAQVDGGQMRGRVLGHGSERGEGT